MPKFIILVGIIITLVGILFYFFGDYFKWVGNLPGDFKIEKENFRFYFPLTTMIIVSVIINILFRLITYLIK